MLKKAEKEVVVIAQFMVKEGKVDEFFGRSGTCRNSPPRKKAVFAMNSTRRPTIPAV